LVVYVKHTISYWYTKDDAVVAASFVVIVAVTLLYGFVIYKQIKDKLNGNDNK